MYNVVRPVNGDGASIQGLELAAQRDFDFLPAPFDKLGFTGNITYAHGRSDVIIDGKAVPLDLFQLSPWTWNATLYYETGRWGARVSSAYRDGYLDGAGGNGNIGSGYHAMNNIDAAAHFNARRGLKGGARGPEPHRPADRPVRRHRRRPSAGSHPQRPRRHPGRRLWFDACLSPIALPAPLPCYEAAHGPVETR